MFSSPLGPDVEDAGRKRILFVDDDAVVLDGWRNLLRDHRHLWNMVFAVGAEDALLELQKAPVDVVVSSMRMPGIDGVAFLARVRQVAPSAVPVLLTGQADLASAVAAVNQGQIFRFLVHPCLPSLFLATVEAAVQQHRLLTAERVLLERTLHGSIKALIDVLALTQPVAFGRATRIKQCASQLAEKLGLGERWQLEVAAMLSQLGFVSLPVETVEKLYYGQALTERERAMVDKVPAVTEQLLGHIPRLEGVRDILAMAANPRRPQVVGDEPAWSQAVRAAQVLRVALELDALEARGFSRARAFHTLRGSAEKYDPQVLEAVGDWQREGVADEDLRELPLSAIRVGMAFAEDVKLVSGTLLVTRGYEVTAGFVERARNFQPGTVKEPVWAIVGHAPT